MRRCVRAGRWRIYSSSWTTLSAVARDAREGDAGNAGSKERGLHFRKVQHLQRPRPVRQTPNEAALLERRDQPVNPRLGFEVERLAHLVETRADPGPAQTFVDEHQQFMLFRGEHKDALLLFPYGTNGERLSNIPGVVKTAGRSA